MAGCAAASPGLLPRTTRHRSVHSSTPWTKAKAASNHGTPASPRLAIAPLPHDDGQAQPEESETVNEKDDIHVRLEQICALKHECLSNKGCRCFADPLVPAFPSRLCHNLRASLSGCKASSRVWPAAIQGGVE